MTVERRFIAVNLMFNFCLTEYSLAVCVGWRGSSRRKAAIDYAARDVAVDIDEAVSGEEAMDCLVLCSRIK